MLPSEQETSASGDKINVIDESTCACCVRQGIALAHLDEKWCSLEGVDPMRTTPSS